MKLSAEEKALVEKLRKEKEDRLPKMVGYAKEDLYQVNAYESENWFASASEREEMIADFSENYIEISAPAGSQFDCYIENGQEAWYDEADGLFAGMDAEWARKYLRDISPVKKSKK